jgi:hypothetical protein
MYAGHCQSNAAGEARAELELIGRLVATAGPACRAH